MDCLNDDLPLLELLCAADEVRVPGELESSGPHENAPHAIVNTYVVDGGRLLLSLWCGRLHEVIYQTPAESVEDASRRNDRRPGVPGATRRPEIRSSSVRARVLLVYECSRARSARMSAWERRSPRGRTRSADPPRARPVSRSGRTPVVRVRGRFWRRYSAAALCC